MESQRLPPKGAGCYEKFMVAMVTGPYSKSFSVKKSMVALESQCLLYVSIVALGNHWLL
jgi:hypothetical protein